LAAADATVGARLAVAKIHLQVDVGFGDAVSPAPRETSYPTMLDVPAPVLRAYPREAVVAEKLHAMVDLGLANSRMKDFFDLWFLATNFPLKGEAPGESIRSTFARRETAIPEETPVALTSEFAGDRQKQIQWTAFVAKSRLAAPSPALAEVVAVLYRFLWPILAALNRGGSPGAQWAIDDGCLVGVTLPLLIGSVAVGLAASARRRREGLVWAIELAKRDRPTASAWAACPGSSAHILIAAFLAFILLGLGPVVWAGLSGTWLELRTLSRIASEAPAAKIALFGEAERAAAIMIERGYVGASLGAVCAALGSGLLLWFASPARVRLRILGRPVSEPPPSRAVGVAVVVFLAAGALFIVARPMKRENETPWPIGGVNDTLPVETPQLEGPDPLEVGPVVELTRMVGRAPPA